MPGFSKVSESNLSTCHPDLQRIARKAIKLFDFSVLEGHRDKEKQNGFFEAGLSKLKWPDSKHNKYPSEAMDLQPYPKNLPDNRGKKISCYSREGEVRFYFLAGIILAIAYNEGIKIRWGGDWNRDTNPHNETWDDLPHFELINARALTAGELLFQSKTSPE